MDIHEIELLDCPLCRGVGLMEEENGWCDYVTCMDCGCRTAEVPYNNEEQRLEAAKRAASTWNMGKIISPANGE